MDSTRFLQITFAVIVTYTIHSTLLLGWAWMVDRRRWLTSHSLREKLWKWAAVAPLLTACLQTGWTNARPVWEFDIGDSRPVSEPVVSGRSIEPEEFRTLNDRSHLLAEQESRPTRARTPAVKHILTPEPSETGPSERPVSAATIADHVEGPGVAERHPSTFIIQQNAGDPVVANVTGTGGTASEWIVQIEPGASAEDVDSFMKLPVHAASPPAVLPAESLPPPVAVAERTVAERYSVPPELNSGPALRALPWYVLSVLVTAMSWMLLGLLRLSMQAIRMTRHLRSCAPITEGPAWRILNQLRLRRSVRRNVVLLYSSQVTEPCACGAFRWSIVLPTGLASKLDDDELRVLLSHELGHLVRRDTVWLWVGRFVLTCLTYQPLNFLAVKRWQESAEFQCDDWAVQDVRNRVTLARVLTNVAGWKSTGTLRPGVPVSAPPLSLRIERLLSDAERRDHWTGVRKRFLLFAVMMSAIGTVALFAPRLVWAEVAEIDPAVLNGATVESGFAPEAATASVPGGSGRIDLLRNDLRSLAQDLELALTLLNQQEQSTEVFQKTDVILRTLKRLRLKIESEGIEQSR